MRYVGASSHALPDVGGRDGKHRQRHHAVREALHFGVRLARVARAVGGALGWPMRDGQHHQADVLVCATGFDVQHALSGVTITGRGGKTLADAWADGPEARLGLTVAGFPNLFLMLGPNTATGHTSTLLFIEPGVRWALQAMQQWELTLEG